MDKSIQYTQTMSNFHSVYNAAPNLVYHPTIYMPISSSSSFSSHQNRSISPSLRSSNLKFNLDLYKPNEYHSDSIDYPSPSSSVIIHHHPVYSPPPSPSQSISKLRQINDELCYTLAKCDLPTQSQPSPRNYYIHHYPISRETSRSRSRSSSEQDSSSTESEPIIKKRNARISYKAHIPRRQHSLSNIDQLLISTSEVYSHNDPMTIDLYPTRDQGFVKKVRNRPDNQSPWLVDNSPIRRDSYSEASTYRTPRAPYYGDKPIQPKSRLASGKERPRSTSVKSRIRPDSAPNPLRQSAVSFSNTAPVWRPNGTIKHPKFIGSHAPPSKPKPLREATWNPASTTNKTKHFRAFDPVTKSLPSKSPEPTWHPPSKTHSEKHHRYFEPTLKPELIVPIRKETAPVLQKKPIKNQKKIPSADPKLKTRIAKAESKVKSAWESTTTTGKEPKPPMIPRPIPKTTIPTKPKVKSVPFQPIVPVKKIDPKPPITTDTGRSSLNDVPTKPLFQSTPRNQSIVHENDDYADHSFDNESHISEPPKEQEISHPPPQIEKTPPKLPHTSVPEPDKGTKPTIKDGILIHGDERTPSPPMSEINNKHDDHEEESLHNHSLQTSATPPKQKAPSLKRETNNDVSIVDDEDMDLHNANDTDEDEEHNLKMNKSLDNEVKDNNDVVSPSTSKADIKTPPGQKKPSPPPPQSPHQSPVITKSNNRQLPSTPPPAPATTHEADDFFD